MCPHPTRALLTDSCTGSLASRSLLMVGAALGRTGGWSPTLGRSWPGCPANGAGFGPWGGVWALMEEGEGWASLGRGETSAGAEEPGRGKRIIVGRTEEAEHKCGTEAALCVSLLCPHISQTHKTPLFIFPQVRSPAQHQPKHLQTRTHHPQTCHHSKGHPWDSHTHFQHPGKPRQGQRRLHVPTSSSPRGTPREDEATYEAEVARCYRLPAAHQPSALRCSGAEPG